MDVGPELSWFHAYFFNISRENKPMESAICVANHTSPIDIVCLGADHTYAMVRKPHIW